MKDLILSLVVLSLF